jgi:DNA-binding NarL/FixJ family response regulator
MNSHPPAGPTRILVVDDHGIVRDGIALLFAREASLSVVGFAATGELAIRTAVRLEPEVVIMDLALPDLSGVEATQRILRRLPGTHIIAFSASTSAEHVHQALRAGARGYLTKDALGAELVTAVKAVCAGERYLGTLIATKVTDTPRLLAAGKSPVERLSAREREVLHRTVGGATTVEIAHLLSLSPKTVDTYRSRLMHKLGVRNRASLIRFALAHVFAPH